MKFLVIIACAFLLASCGVHYNNSVRWRGVTQSPVGYDTAHLTHGDPTPIYDSVYTVSPTWWQAWQWAGQRNDRVWFWIGIALIVIPMAIFVYLGNKGGYGGWILIFPFFAILVGGGITGGSIDWERWNMDQTITKQQYDQLMQKDGDLHEFWDTIRIK